MSRPIEIERLIAIVVPAFDYVLDYAFDRWEQRQRQGDMLDQRQVPVGPRRWINRIRELHAQGDPRVAIIANRKFLGTREVLDELLTEIGRQAEVKSEEDQRVEALAAKFGLEVVAGGRR